MQSSTHPSPRRGRPRQPEQLEIHIESGELPLHRILAQILQNRGTRHD